MTNWGPGNYAEIMEQHIASPPPPRNALMPNDSDSPKKCEELTGEHLPCASCINLYKKGLLRGLDRDADSLDSYDSFNEELASADGRNHAHRKANDLCSSSQDGAG